jgi:uncharacterized protein YbjT (DUF2867 family)
MAKDRVLVTGAAGFSGSHMEQLVLEHHRQADRSGVDVEAGDRKMGGCII